jgi:hydroxymethylpyrimidine/phosphomethylpyrimidine kinase
MNDEQKISVALTIAGSDSGGGAGIQTDLKTFMASSVFGTSAITCVTAQNPDGVSGVEAISPDMVELQIRSVAEGFPIAATKTGMLYSSEIIHAVTQAVEKYPLGILVVDPVMIATSGGKLLRDDAVAALCSELLPVADVITPNLPEAEILCGHKISTKADLINAAEEIGEKFDVACIAKGGHLDVGGGDEVFDVLYDNGETITLASPMIAAKETHGTGCTFAAAVTANLALGNNLLDSFSAAKEFVASALKNARQAGRHYPLGITVCE